MAVATGTTVGTIVLAGDLAGGSDPTNPQLTPTGVTPGKYIGASVIVDAKGRIVNAQKLSGLDVGCATKTQCGIAKIGREITATTASDGRTVASLKKASTTEFGVVKLGTGFGRTCCEIFLSYAVASPTMKGVVQVPPTGYLKLVDAMLSIPLATTTTMGTVSVPTANGLSVTGGSMAFNSAGAAWPTASTSATGILSVPTAAGLTVAGDGTASYNSSGAAFVKATTTYRGLVSGPSTNGLFLGSGFMSFDGTAATGYKEATTSTVGIMQVGSGINVSANLISIPTGSTSVRGAIRGDTSFTTTAGTLSWTRAASASVLGGVKVGAGLGVTVDGVLSIGGDATKSSKGYVQLAANQGLTLTGAVLDVVVGSASVKGIVRGDSTLINNNGILTADVPATASTAGLVKIGSGITLTGETISATESLLNGSKYQFGKVGIGNNIDVDVNGVISVKVTSASVVGLAKLGNGFSSANGFVDLSGVVKNSGNLSTDFFKINNGVVSIDPADEATLSFPGRSYNATNSYPVLSTTGTSVNLNLANSLYQTQVLTTVATTVDFGGTSGISGAVYTFVVNAPVGCTFTFNSSAWYPPFPEGSTEFDSRRYVTTAAKTIITAVARSVNEIGYVQIISIV